MLHLSWLLCTVCAQGTCCYSFFGALSRESVSFFPLEEDMLKSCEAGGDVVRIPSKALGLGETVTWFYYLHLCRCFSERDWLEQVYQVSKGHCQHQVCLKSDLYHCVNWESWKWPGSLTWCFGKAQQVLFNILEGLRFTDHLSSFMCTPKLK